MRQLAIMQTIDNRPDIACGSLIAEHLAVSDAQVFTALYRLESQRLVVQSERPRERRKGRPRIYYELTEAGREVMHDTVAMIDI